MIVAILATSACRQVFGLDEPSRAANADADVDAELDSMPSDDDDLDGVLDAADNCPLDANADQRDWDADARGDVCDACPHIAQTADQDSDGDEVGDLCDPRPTLAGDMRVLWLGFYDAADIAGWTSQGTWTVVGGKLEQAMIGGDTQLGSPASYRAAHFETRMEIVEGQTTDIGFCSGASSVPEQYYCCSLSGAMSLARAFALQSGAPLTTTAAFAGSTAVGATIDVRGTHTATSFTCQLSQGGVAAAASVTVGPTAGVAAFFTTAAVKFHYAFVVEIGP